MGDDDQELTEEETAERQQAAERGEIVQPAYAVPVKEGQTPEEAAQEAQEAQDAAGSPSKFVEAPRIVSERTAVAEAAHEEQRQADEGYDAREEEVEE